MQKIENFVMHLGYCILKYIYPSKQIKFVNNLKSGKIFFSPENLYSWHLQCFYKDSSILNIKLHTP